MSRLEEENDDPILDLNGLFHTLWSNIILIGMFVILGLIFAVFIARSSSITYRAEAVIEIAKKENRGTTSGNTLTSIRNFAFPNNFKDSNSFLPRVTGHEFLKMS